MLQGHGRTFKGRRRTAARLMRASTTGCIIATANISARSSRSTCSEVVVRVVEVVVVMEVAVRVAAARAVRVAAARVVKEGGGCASRSRHLHVRECDRRGRVDELWIVDDEVFAPHAARPEKVPAAAAEPLAEDVE